MMGSNMPRIDIFEFEDLDWFPQTLRNSTTDFLRKYIHLSNIYNIIFEDIYKVLKKTQTSKIVDLCSGGGGPHIRLLDYLNKKKMTTLILKQ